MSRIYILGLLGTVIMIRTLTDDPTDPDGRPLEYITSHKPAFCAIQKIITSFTDFTRRHHFVGKTEFTRDMHNVILMM